ncbi:MAG: M56 family metallopeptidase [Gemmatimonadales bacterium]
MTESQLLTFVVTAALKGTVILGIAGLVIVAWRSASAASRHLVWTLAVTSALVVPFIGEALSRANGPQIEVAAWTPPESSVDMNNEPAPIPVSRIDSRAVTELASPALEIRVPEDAGTAAVPTLAVEARTEPSFRMDWSAALFYLWIAGMLVALLPLAVALIRVKVLSRRAHRVRAGAWMDLLARTPSIAHLARSVTLIESEATTMPMTWGIVSPTLLVPSCAEQWPEWQRRNVLLHELAHVERRDCLTQLVAQIACAFYWFNPLIWVAAHRMRVERELACDDRVISSGSSASDYAANLLAVARTLRAPSHTSCSAIAMARPSQLSGRLLAVLDTSRNRRSVTRRAAAAVSLSAVAVVLPLASLTPGAAAAAVAEAPAALPSGIQEIAPPIATVESRKPAPFVILQSAIVRAAQLPAIGLIAPAAEGNGHLAGPAVSPPLPALSAISVQDPVCWSVGEGSTNISINDDDNSSRSPSTTVRFTREGCSLDMRAEGKFTLRPDLSDVESLARDGWFRIEERQGRSTRRMEIRRADNGTLDHIYWVNGDRAPYDDAARAWLARTLLAVERRTAFAAATRVPQIYRTSGLRGVLAEISLINSAYPKSKYYGALLDMGVTLDAATLNGIVRQISIDMASSDYYMSEVLSKFASQGSANEATWRGFAEAAGKMKSDYYKSQTLKKVLTKGRLSNATVGILLQSASGMKSDYYLSELLKSVASQYALNAETRGYYAEALSRIESDYYRSELLQAMGGDGAWDRKTSALVMSSVSGIKSDYYKSEALRSLVRGDHVDDWASFFSATQNIDSDYYKNETLNTALSRDPLSREVVIGVLGVAAKMKSDSEISEILASVARRYRIDDAVRPAFEKAVDAIDSEYYRGAALAALRRSAARE